MKRHIIRRTAADTQQKARTVATPGSAAPAHEQYPLHRRRGLGGGKKIGGVSTVQLSGRGGVGTVRGEDSYEALPVRCCYKLPGTASRAAPPMPEKRNPLIKNVA